MFGLGLQADLVLRFVFEPVDVDRREVIRDRVVGGPRRGARLAVLDLDLTVIRGGRFTVDGDLTLPLGWRGLADRRPGRVVVAVVVLWIVSSLSATTRMSYASPFLRSVRVSVVVAPSSVE